MSESSRADGIEERLVRVERACRGLARQNRWLKVCVIVVPFVVLVAGAAVQDRDITARTVTAERLVMKDAKGKERASLQYKAAAGSYSFEMFDPSGARRISLHAFDNGITSMYQHYGDGKMFSFGWVTPGSDGKFTPNFAFRGPDGAMYAAMKGKAPTEPPVIEVYSGDKDKNSTIGTLGGKAP